MMNRREFMEAVINVCNGGAFEDVDEIRGFCEKELAQVDHRNLKARERAAKRKDEGDAFKGVIAGLLTDEPKVIADIMNEVNEVEGYEDMVLTPSKVVARMTQLCKDGQAERVKVNIEGRKLVGYVKA